MGLVVVGWVLLGWVLPALSEQAPNDVRRQENQKRWNNLAFVIR
jgi:hypothetical protein